MFIIDDTVASSDWEASVKQVHDILKNRGIEILKSEKWEERKFAYKLKGHKRGTYLLTYFKAPEDSISLIKRDLQLSENVLRSLIVRVNKIKETKPKETEKPKEEPVVNSDDTKPTPVVTSE